MLSSTLKFSSSWNAIKYRRKKRHGAPICLMKLFLKTYEAVTKNTKQLLIVLCG